MENRRKPAPPAAALDINCDCKEYVIDYLAKSFPVRLMAVFTDENGNPRSEPMSDEHGAPVLCRSALAARDRMIEQLCALPPIATALDAIIERFGVDQVAEVTGRTRRLIVGRDGCQKLQSRSPRANVAETQAFMDGSKHILVFSDAGGTGRSYHADLAAKNQARRVHFLLEPGWRADAAIQGLGRTNRTNQASAPLFRPVTTDVRGERRFISTIARRLDSLGALTRGQRQTGGQNLFDPADNLESIYAKEALHRWFGLLFTGKLEAVSLGRFQELTGLRIEAPDGSMVDDLPSIQRWLNRIYAIQWMDASDIKKGKAIPRTWFAVPTQADLEREELVKDVVLKNLSTWQAAGLVPDMEIEPGYNTSQPIRERGWTHWHHMFNPRHLLINATVAKYLNSYPEGALIALNFHNQNASLCRWATGATREALANVFSNQALNTLLNYGARGYDGVAAFLDVPNNKPVAFTGHVLNQAAKDFSEPVDIFVTDPPYADAVQYDEITEFFIAWLRKNPPAPFSEWIWDSRRNLAIKGEGQSFKTAMIDAYGAMTEHMSENGLQIVQFTHQDAKTWSDMAQIFWGAGLQVVQDWYVSTETITGLKLGGYVQGTHMIVLRKRQGEQSGYQDEIVHEIRDEVERQIRDMIGLNDQMDAARGENIFNDADLQMAGYAAALRVLTAYTKIDGKDMTQEALRPRKKGEKTLVDELTEFAVQTANEFLVPDGLERELWLELNGAERFYLKMMDIEEAGEAKLDQFQNFAKAFRVGDYDDLMASKTPNNAKLKTAKGLGRGAMAEGVQFGRDSIVRLALRGVWRVGKGDEVEEVLEELREFIPDYLRKRDTLSQLVAYVAAKRGRTDPEEASAARILGTAIQTERI
jgi:hypothetical protein